MSRYVKRTSVCFLLFPGTKFTRSSTKETTTVRTIISFKPLFTILEC